MADLIPKGNYPAVAIKQMLDGNEVWAQFGAAKTGTKQVLLYFEIIGDGPHAGKVIPWFGYFTADTVRRTFESLRYCGFRGDDLMKLNSQSLDQEVSITVDHQDYDGKTYARVGFVNRAGGGAIKLAQPMGEGELRMFAAEMARHARQAPEVAGKRAERGDRPAVAPSGQTPGPERTAGLDPDIPF
jgi:hypothetical protein